MCTMTEFGDRLESSSPLPFLQRIHDVRVLSGTLIDLVPLHISHTSALFAAQDDSMWTLNPKFAPMATEKEFRENYMRVVLAGREVDEFPLAVIAKCSGVPIGVMRFLDIKPQHRGLEIGGVWYVCVYCG